MAQVTQEKEKFLETLVVEATKGVDHQKAIRHIKTRERTKRQFQRKRSTLGWLQSGSLSSIDVPVVLDKGKIKGWQLITNPKELHATVVEQNMNHLHQAVPNRSATENSMSYSTDLIVTRLQRQFLLVTLNGNISWKR